MAPAKVRPSSAPASARNRHRRWHEVGSSRRHRRLRQRASNGNWSRRWRSSRRHWCRQGRDGWSCRRRHDTWRARRRHGSWSIWIKEEVGRASIGSAAIVAGARAPRRRRRSLQSMLSGAALGAGSGSRPVQTTVRLRYSTRRHSTWYWKSVAISASSRAPAEVLVEVIGAVEHVVHACHSPSVFQLPEVLVEVTC